MCFVLNSGYPTFILLVINDVFQYMFFKTHTQTLFELIDKRLGFINTRVPIWLNRGYYNLVSELRLTDSGEGTHVQRSVAQLGSSVGR